MSENKQAIMDEIGASRRELIDLAESLDAAALARPTCCEGWDVKGILSHVTASEAGLLRNARGAVSGEPIVRPPGFDLAKHNQQQVDDRRDWSVAQIVAEMKQNRAAVLEFLASTPEEHLARMGRIGPRELSAGQIIAHIAVHEHDHAEEIRKALA